MVHDKRQNTWDQKMIETRTINRNQWVEYFIQLYAAVNAVQKVEYIEPSLNDTNEVSINEEGDLI